MRAVSLAGLIGISALGTTLASCGISPSPASQATPPVNKVAAFDTAQRCGALGDGTMKIAWPDVTTRITSAVYHQEGMAEAPSPFGKMSAHKLPAHCEITGIMQEHKGVDGQDYAVRFHIRLPDAWNNRFFFQGGGGTNGELGDAVGQQGTAIPALVQGYAVLSQDSGHDNRLNSVKERGGQTSFGFDPQARAEYGGVSLQRTATAAKAAILDYYGKAPDYSYFVGCSKGGQEGMALAQRYPDLFDGIVAAAPGFSLPRAAIAEAWNTRAFASVDSGKGVVPTLTSLSASFSDKDLDLAREAVLDACDSDDGLKDGIIGAFRQCTSDKVLPKLLARTCNGAKADGCLSTLQVAALKQVHEGPRTTDGKQVYPGFPWDAGWHGMGWRVWMIGSSDGRVPPLNVAMGAPALAAIFSTPPVALGADVAAYLRYQTEYDFDQGVRAVNGVRAPFTRSSWQDISARSSNLAAFRQRGGKMIVPHGVSDPVFSINDTIEWWEEVNRANQGQAADFARLFPVPGMAHCGGGPATDVFDAFGTLVQWVEQGKAPESIAATAGPSSPWPGRDRPLCRYPLVARLVEGSDKGPSPQFRCVP